MYMNYWYSEDIDTRLIVALLQRSTGVMYGCMRVEVRCWLGCRRGSHLRWLWNAKRSFSVVVKHLILGCSQTTGIRKTLTPGWLSCHRRQLHLLNWRMTITFMVMSGLGGSCCITRKFVDDWLRADATIVSLCQQWCRVGTHSSIPLHLKWYHAIWNCVVLCVGEISSLQPFGRARNLSFTSSVIQYMRFGIGTALYTLLGVSSVSNFHHSVG